MADPAAADVPADPTRNELAKLPLWHGNKTKDTFSPLQWLERVETAKDACDWTDRHTMAFVYMALRNDALQWYDGLARDGVNKQVYQEFKDAFLMAYEPARTARTAMINVHDLKQASHETVVNFRTRVIRAIDDIEALLPPEGRAPRQDRYGPEIRALAGFNALAVNVKEETARRYMVDGATIMLNHVALQIFVAGLRQAIREEMMKAMPPTFLDAYKQALNLERAMAEPSKAFVSVQAVDAQTEDSLETELAAVQAKLNKFRAASRGQSRGRGGRGGRSQSGQQGGQQQASQQQQQTGDYNKCRYCLKFGHLQKFCSQRIAAKAPMLDKNNKPYGNGVNEIENQGAQGGPPQQNGAQQNQQAQGGGGQNSGGAQGYFTQHQGTSGYFVPSPGPPPAPQGIFGQAPDFQY